MTRGVVAVSGLFMASETVLGMCLIWLNMLWTLECGTPRVLVDKSVGPVAGIVICSVVGIVVDVILDRGTPENPRTLLSSNGTTLLPLHPRRNHHT